MTNQSIGGEPQGKSWKDRFWPNIPDLETAQKFANVGAYLSVFVAIIGFIAAPTDFWDSLVFLAIAWGIRMMYRTAAIIGLVVYIFERVWLTIHFHSPVGITMGVLFTIVFINSVRATFAYHKMQAKIG